MVLGLTEAYSGVGTLIRQSNPLPLLYQARSMLILEEAALAKKAATGSNSAMMAARPRSLMTIHLCLLSILKTIIMVVADRVPTATILGDIVVEAAAVVEAATAVVVEDVGGVTTNPGSSSRGHNHGQVDNSGLGSGLLGTLPFVHTLPLPGPGLIHSTDNNLGSLGHDHNKTILQQPNLLPLILKLRCTLLGLILRIQTGTWTLVPRLI